MRAGTGIVVPAPASTRDTVERICLLTDQDIDEDPFPEDDWPCDPRPFLPDAEWTLMVLEKDSCVAEVIRAAHSGRYDLFFNLCDSAWDEGRVGIEVVQTLEALNVPFTGADSDFFEPSREVMKRVCHAWGLHTPEYAFVSSPDEVPMLLERLRFPMFVKHPSSYASNALVRASRVVNRKELEAQVERITKEFGSALVEEFIEGAECTTLVAENAEDPTAPIVYQPLQYRFPEGETFKHYDLKWVDYDGLESFLVEDPVLDADLRRASADFFLGMRGAGYGRCDIRVDAEGTPYILEINPNCGMYYPPTDPASSDLILMSDPAGHAGFTRAVVDAALARHRRRQRAWTVGKRPEGDYGLFTTREVSEGERLIVFEQRPHHLVSRSYALKHFGGRHRDWFERYAWPLTDEIWVTWHDDPEEWRPINHSCDPNAWLEGLDVMALRDIERGEEITLEYATFMDERMPAFECACGSAKCRGVIRGEDYLLDAMARYEGHMSDHVSRRRAERR